ncbi:hypothetical protein [Pseudomonas asiatica]|uniref:hypothetical protein n=1 Tax=Pseudomonas asiatica TaxID=2219225 RepID=UPI00236622F0|nr:hypothetical protein [Pseudomonas asiatica]MDD1982392.1 hypothetical protein [Pseudomonas asiatica]
MPTENRSSNTDPRDVFIRLNPLGLGEAELRKDSTGFEDQRTHSDYLLFLAGYRETHPEQQPHPEPIAWMVGTAFWWTKEEAERDAADTGLLVVPFGPLTGSAEAEQHQGDPVVLPARLPQRMPQGRNLPRNYAEAWNACLTEVEKLGPLYPRADPGEGDRLSKATAFVQRLVDCAGTQPSVATGYLRDILDELKGNTTPTAPVAHNENAAFEIWARSRLTPLNLRLDEIGLYHDLVAGTAHDAWQARAALEIKAS